MLHQGLQAQAGRQQRALSKLLVSSQQRLTSNIQRGTASLEVSGGMADGRPQQLQAFLLVACFF
jgi:hypothetical protein